MKRKILAGICFAALLFLLTRLRADAPSGAPVTAADATADKALVHVFNELRFDGTRLDAAIEQLGEAAGVTIEVDWESLESEKVHRDTPVRLTLFDLPLSKALSLVLFQTSDVFGDHALDYAIIDGVVKVSRVDHLRGFGVLRMYDATDLIAALAGPAPSERDSPPGYWRARQEQVDMLDKLLQKTVDPNSWRDNGGTVGTFREFGGRLFITQSRKNHQQIERLLAQLREMIAARARGEKVVGWPIEPVPNLGLRIAR